MISHQTYRNDHSCECGAVIRYELPASGSASAGDDYSLGLCKYCGREHTVRLGGPPTILEIVPPHKKPE
jgi:hypothetical protein